MQLAFWFVSNPMAPHSSTLAWKIPWTEEPGRLQSLGLLRVGHDWASSHSLFTFYFLALEKEMATHSSVLAWRIPGMGEPGGLPSMGSHGVGHDWSDLAAAQDYTNHYTVQISQVLTKRHTKAPGIPGNKWVCYRLAEINSILIGVVIFEDYGN